MTLMAEALDELPRFKYSGISDLNKIRVLHLRNATPKYIEFRLEEIEYTARGYQALSYAWGSENIMLKGVVVDGRGVPLGYVPLTGNLVHALYDLHKAPGVKSKVFWIDQICIDQDGDQTGKSNEVARMAEIYSNATRVIVYVGYDRDEDEAEKGHQMLNRLYQHFSPNLPMFRRKRWNDIRREPNDHPVTEMPEDLNYRSGHQDKDKLRRQWKWLIEVCFGTWTRRLWILQELLLNAEIKMLRGTRLLDWRPVLLMIMNFAFDRVPQQLVKSTFEESHDRWVAPLDISKAAFIIWDQRERASRALEGNAAQIEPEAWRHAIRTRTLDSNLLSFLHLQCKLPRDHIYGLLSVSSDAQEIGLIPDYKSTTDVIFRDVSARLLMHVEKFSFLVLVSRVDHETDPDASSWALNVSRPYAKVSAHLDYWRTRSAHPRAKVSRPMKIVEDGKVLVLTGRKVDEIATTSPPAYNTPNMVVTQDDGKYAPKYVALLNSISAAFSRLGSTFDAALSIARALTQELDCSPHDRKSGKEDRHLVACLWSRMRSCYVYMTRRPNVELNPAWSNMLDNMSATIHPQGSDAGDMHSWADSDWFDVNMKWRGRSYGVTEGGRAYNAMNVVRPGDHIFVFEGCIDRLWTLRSVGKGRYRLVGDNWTDGLMDGTLYDGIDPSDVDHDVEIV